jgi:periplasmic protein TonB
MVIIMSSYALKSANSFDDILEKSSATQIHPIVKHVLAITLGATVTLALFVTMYNLIKNDAMPVEAPPTKPMPQLSYKPPKIQTDHNLPEPPVKPEIQVQPSVENRLDPITTEVLKVVPVIPVIVDPNKGKILVIENNNVLPMVRVNPVYPQVAASKGIEGFVDVIFDVTETGSTQNVQVVYAEPERIFNAAVIRAVSRWKYKPKMEDGVAVRMQGVRDRIRFKLDK